MKTEIQTPIGKALVSNYFQKGYWKEAHDCGDDDIWVEIPNCECIIYWTNVEFVGRFGTVYKFSGSIKAYSEGQGWRVQRFNCQAGKVIHDITSILEEWAKKYFEENPCVFGPHKV